MRVCVGIIGRGCMQMPNNVVEWYKEICSIRWRGSVITASIINTLF